MTSAQISAFQANSSIAPAAMATVIVGLVFAVLLPLPLIDEIVGRQQFEQLCKVNSTIQVDRETAGERTVYFVHQPDTEIKGTWVRIVLQPALFVDATTSKPVIRFNDLIAEGGVASSNTWYI